MTAPKSEYRIRLFELEKKRAKEWLKQRGRGMRYANDMAEFSSGVIGLLREALAHAVKCMDRNCKRCNSLLKEKE